MVNKNLILNFMGEKGFTLSEMARFCGLPKQTLRTIIYQKSDVRLSTIQKIADSMKVSLDDLAGREFLPKKERAIIEKMKELPSRSKTLIKEIMELEYQVTCCNSSKKQNIISVFAPTKYFYDGLYFDSLYHEQIDIGKHPYNNIIICGLRITSNEFAPTYMLDDVLLIARDRPPIKNESAVFLKDNHMYLRRFMGNQLDSIGYIKNSIEIHDLNDWHIFGYVFSVFRNQEVNAVKIAT